MLTSLPYELPKEFAYVDGYPCPHHLHIEQFAPGAWRIYYMRTSHPMMEDLSISEVIPGTLYTGRSLEEVQGKLLGALNSVDQLQKEYRVLQDLGILNWYEWKSQWSVSKLLDRDYDLIDKTALSRLGISNGLLESMYRNGIYEEVTQVNPEGIPENKLCFSLNSKVCRWYMGHLQQSMTP